MKTPFVIGLLVVVSLLNFGCVKRDIDKISEAQDCLDTATSANALTCMEKIEGVETAGANLIRCSAYFVDQGFADTTRLASVAERISSSNGTPQDNTFAALSVMGFVATKYTKSENNSLSEKSLAVCEKSKSPGLIYLSSLSRISTVILNVSAYDHLSGNPPTTTELENVVCNNPDSAVLTAIGMAAIAAYQNDCVLHQGSGQTTDAVCQQYATAIANNNSDPLAVGTALSTNLCP